MLSRFLTRAAPPVVALSVIALVPTLALLGRLGLLTDPMVLASFVLVIGFLTVGLVTTVRRVGNPIGWLLLWQGVVAGFSLLGRLRDVRPPGGSRAPARRIAAVVDGDLDLVGSPGCQPGHPCAVP